MKTEKHNGNSLDPIHQLLHLIAESRTQREQAEQPTLERSLARFRDLTSAPERRRLVAIYLAEVFTND